MLKITARVSIRQTLCILTYSSIGSTLKLFLEGLQNVEIARNLAHEMLLVEGVLSLSRSNSLVEHVADVLLLDAWLIDSWDDRFT